MRIFKYSLARSGLAAQLLGEGGEDDWRRRKVVEKKGGREERWGRRKVKEKKDGG